MHNPPPEMMKSKGVELYQNSRVYQIGVEIRSYFWDRENMIPTQKLKIN